MWKRALEVKTRVLGKEHPDTLKSVNNLAAFCTRAQGRYGLAEPLYKRALEAYDTRSWQRAPGHAPLASIIWRLTIIPEKNWRLAERFLDRGTRGYAKAARLTGGASLSGQTKTAAQRQGSAFKIYLKTLHQLGQENITIQKLLGKKAFKRLQWSEGTGAASALSQMASRFGAADDVLAQRVRERQDLVRIWRQLDAAFNKAVSLPPKKTQCTI